MILTAAHSAFAGDSRHDRAKLVGTWFTHVTVRDCGSGADLRSFTSLATFSSDGTLVDTTTGFAPAARTPGHGRWEQKGRNKFESISLAFLFNPAGLWTGTQRITQDIEINQDKYTSTAAIRIFDPTGNMTAKGCAVSTATQVEPVENEDDPLKSNPDQ